MRIPVIRGIIGRRILVNYRVDRKVLARILPAPFRPKLINGAGMAGVCLIPLKNIRPQLLPSFVGISSDYAAPPIAVWWDQNSQRGGGGLLPRRDTQSRCHTCCVAQ